MTEFTLRIMGREIAAAMQACSQIVSASAAIPILRATRISAEAGRVSFTATNTDQTVIVSAAADGSGVVCLDTPALAAKVMALRPNDPVEFEGEGKFVTVTQGRTKWKIPCLIDDFPLQVTAPVSDEPVKVGAEFISAVRQVHSVIDSGHNLAAITGVSVQESRVMATDGKRMRIVGIPHQMPRPFIIPGWLAPRMVAMFPDGGELRASESMLSISSEWMTVNSRLVDGVFPPAQKIVTQHEAAMVSRVMVDAGELLAAIKRACAINATGDKAASFLNMQMQFRADEITVFARNLDGEEGTDTVRAERAEGEDADVGFSGRAVMDEIASLDSEVIEIRHGDERTHAIFQVLGNPNNLRFVQARDFR